MTTEKEKAEKHFKNKNMSRNLGTLAPGAFSRFAFEKLQSYNFFGCKIKLKATVTPVMACK